MRKLFLSHKDPRTRTAIRISNGISPFCAAGHIGNCLFFFPDPRSVPADFSISSGRGEINGGNRELRPSISPCRPFLPYAAVRSRGFLPFAFFAGASVVPAAKALLTAYARERIG